MTTYIHHFIEQNAEKNPAAIALRLKSDTLTYAELNELINKVARGLIHLGLSRHDRVGIYLPKTFESVASIFAASAANGAFVPINPVLKSQQVQHIINDCNVRVLITNSGRLEGLKKHLTQLPSLTHIVVVDDQTVNVSSLAHTKLLNWQALLSSTSSQLPDAFTTNDMAAILYTSGSTGQPKGVVLSHNNLIQGAISVAQYLNNTSADIILSVLPFSFDYGLSQLTTAFYAGASCVLLDYLLPNDIIKAIDKYQVTGLAAVPPLWSQLCTIQWPVNSANTLRYLTNSGGALSTSHITTLQTRLPNAQLFLMYGLTEAFRSTYLPPEQIALRPTSIGKAIPNAEILVIRPDGTECDANEEGELVHKGPLVSLGYWNNIEKTEKRFKSAPARSEGIMTPELAVWSGDTVKRDADGYLYFVARSDDMIKTSGYRVSPLEIEQVLYQHQYITNVVAMGVKHPQLDQAILVIASGHDELDDERMIKSMMLHCQRELPNYMVPKQIILLDHLPQNANGKLDRTTLYRTYKDYFLE